MDELNLHDRVSVDGDTAFVTGIRDDLVSVVFASSGSRRSNVPTSLVLLVSEAQLPLTEQDASDRFMNGTDSVCAVCGSHGAGSITCGGPGRADITMCSVHAQEHHAATRALRSQLVAA